MPPCASQTRIFEASSPFFRGQVRTLSWFSACVTRSQPVSYMSAKSPSSERGFSSALREARISSKNQFAINSQVAGGFRSQCRLALRILYSRCVLAFFSKPGPYVRVVLGSARRSLQNRELGHLSAKSPSSDRSFSCASYEAWGRGCAVAVNSQVFDGFPLGQVSSS